MPRYKSVQWLYCCDVCGVEEEETMVGDRVRNSDEIVRNQRTADMAIRREGWVIRADGTIVGPECADNA